MAGTNKLKMLCQDAPVIILVEPQLGENIGTAARAMGNFALSELRIVNPREEWPNKKALAAASGADIIINNAKIYTTVEEALADLNYVYATTTRTRKMVKSVVTPEIAGIEARDKITSGQKVGILFGREKSGLINDDIALADAILMAPVNPGFSSLNLAQAVLLIGYEWFKQGEWSLGDHTRDDGGLLEPGIPMVDTRPATRDELFGFFYHLEDELDKSGFLRPIEKRPAMVRNIRNMFHRTNLTEQEIRTLRGMISGLVRKH